MDAAEWEQAHAEGPYRRACCARGRRRSRPKPHLGHRRFRASPAALAARRVPISPPLFPRAEPITGFRVCAGGSLKTKIEEWKVPYSYTSDPRNLLQRHFRKVTAGSWFEGGAVIVLTPVAESVERTWGLEQKQPHPKWGGVVWHA